MNQVDGVGQIAESREGLVRKNGNTAAFPVVEKKDNCRQRVNHACGAELMNCVDGGKSIVTEVFHYARIRGDHYRSGDELKEVDPCAV